MTWLMTTYDTTPLVCMWYDLTHSCVTQHDPWYSWHYIPPHVSWPDSFIRVCVTLHITTYVRDTTYHHIYHDMTHSHVWHHTRLIRACKHSPFEQYMRVSRARDSYLMFSHRYSSVFDSYYLLDVFLKAMGWLRLVDSLKLQVSFANEPYKRDYVLQQKPMILRSLLIVAIPYSLRTLFLTSCCRLASQSVLI